MVLIQNFFWIPDGLKMTGAATRAVTTNGAEKRWNKIRYSWLLLYVKFYSEFQTDLLMKNSDQRN